MNENRIRWLKRHEAKAQYCHLGIFGALGTNNTEDNFVWDVQSDLKQLLIDRDALVLLAKEYYSLGKSEPLVAKSTTWHLLSQELRDAISGG